MANGETRVEAQDFSNMDVIEVEDTIKSARSFKELIEELNGFKGNNLDKKARMQKEEYTIKKLVDAFEAFLSYVTLNPEKLTKNQEKIRSYLDGGMYATRILGLNKDLQNAAVRLARIELGLPPETLSM